MRLKKNVRIVGAERATLAAAIHARYMAGEAIKPIAASLGRSYGFVHQLLEETGTTFRPRGGATRTRTEATTA